MAQLASVSALGAEGREFESHHPDQMKAPKILVAAVLVLLLVGSAARVFRPLNATGVPKNNAVVSPATINTGLPTTSVTIGGQTFQVEVASTDAQKAQGLSGRNNLAKNAGMLFVFDSPSQPDFWMKDMNFPLDFVWISGGRITGINRNVPAPQSGTAAKNLPTYAAPGLVDYVLEVNAGAGQAIKIGDEVTVSNAQSI